MKLNSQNRAAIAARLRSYRRAQLGAFALLSMSTIRALSAVEDREINRTVRSIVNAGKTDDTISDAETDTGKGEDRYDDAPRAVPGAYTLTPAERASLPGYRGVIFRQNRPAPVNDEPLPADFRAVTPVESYKPLTIRDVQIEAEAAREAAAEIVENESRAFAVSFESDFDGPFPIDYAPIVPVLTVTPAPAPVAPVAPVSEHESLRLAVLRAVRAVA